MKIQLYLLAKIANKSKGFTLLELLMASVLTFLVVSGIGYALVLMTKDNISSQVSGDLVFNTTRSADFITDEIRQATFLSTSSADIPTTTGSGIESCAMQSGEQFVVGLAINSSQVNIVYYTKTPPSNPWLGPSSIYRCGPPLDSNGQLDTTKRTKNILVDSITTNATARNEACASGTTKFPASPSAGFFLCVNNGNPNLVELRLTSRSDKLASDGVGAGRSAESSASGNFRVVTTAFTRAASGVATLNGSGTCSGVTVAVDGRPAVNFTSGMTVVATKASTMVFSPSSSLWLKTSPSATQDIYTYLLLCTISANF